MADEPKRYYYLVDVKFNGVQDIEQIDVLADDDKEAREIGIELAHEYFPQRHLRWVRPNYREENIEGEL